jgi:hypothetical protein
MNDDNAIFLNNLHRNFKFISNGKTIKEGKLILFNLNDFYYSFTLDVSGNMKNFKMPMAFSVTDNLSSIRLDYKIKTLCHNIYDFEIYSRTIEPKSKTYFYDNIVEMVFV